jgi:hypothetical protein
MPIAFRVGNAEEARGEGAKVIGHTIVKAAGHGKLVADGDFLLLLGRATGPACAEIIGSGVGYGQMAFLLRDAHHKGSDGFASRGPIPRAVLGERCRNSAQ